VVVLDDEEDGQLVDAGPVEPLVEVALTGAALTDGGVDDRILAANLGC